MTAARPVLLLTRPAQQSARFAAAVEARLGFAFDQVISPLLEVRDLEATGLERSLKGVIFTSENGVHAFARATSRRDLVAWCVGDRTAEAAREAGFIANSAAGNVDALVTLLAGEGVAGPLLYARGRHIRGNLAESLTSAGIETTEAVVYDQRPCPLTAAGAAALAGSAPIFAPLFSPRTAALFAKAAANSVAPIHVVAMSSAVAAEIKALECASVTVAARPDAQAMIDALADRFAADSLA